MSTAANVAFGRDLETGFDLRDAAGNTIGLDRAGDPVFWRTLLNQELRNIPLVNALDSPSYKSADALPFTGTRHYPKGYEVTDELGSHYTQAVRQPDMPTRNTWIAYFTGIRVRPTDLTLYNLQEAYKLLDDAGLDPKQRRAVRHRINIELGKAKRNGLKVTVPTGSDSTPQFSTPEFSKPDFAVPEFQTAGG